MGQLLHQLRDSLAVAGQAFENKTNGRGAVMSQLHLANGDTGTAFAAEHSVVFDHAFRNVRLSDRSSYNLATVTRSNLIYGACGRNIRDNRACLLPETNLGGNNKRHLFGQTLT